MPRSLRQQAQDRIDEALARQRGEIPPDPRLTGMTNWMKTQREGDITGGMDFAKGYFGADNPAMAEILAARKAQAFGTDGATQLAREAGTENINRSVQTALRQFAGRLPGTGVRGGAAGAMAGMLTRDAVGQTRGLERDLAINEMARKADALKAYESSLTGERAGLLGTGFAHAGMGSQDRYGGMQFLQGGDFLKQAQAAMGGSFSGGGGGTTGMIGNMGNLGIKAGTWYGDRVNSLGGGLASPSDW